jgi:hypothetical protein
VAIKVLPEEVAQDEARLARFAEHRHAARVRALRGHRGGRGSGGC